MDEQNLMVARRLMVATAEYEARWKAKRGGKPRSLKDAWDEDEAQLSRAGLEAAASKTKDNDRDVRMRLGDLRHSLREPAGPPAAAVRSMEAAALEITQVQTEVEIKLQSWAPVDGLVVRNQNLAETDRYEFLFQDGATFRITDKWSGRSTTIWGDPHVDTSDEDGASNGEFSDLNDSNTHTTLALQDGTRVTFTALDNGLIEAVDIYLGGQHLRGIGAASEQWHEDTGLFEKAVTASSGANVPVGDLVRAGGDGNDWFDSAGQLVWGKTTGPAPLTRPALLMQVNFSQSVTHLTATQTIERWG